MIRFFEAVERWEKDPDWEVISCFCFLLKLHVIGQDVWRHLHFAEVGNQFTGTQDWGATWEPKEPALLKELCLKNLLQGESYTQATRWANKLERGRDKKVHDNIAMLLHIDKLHNQIKCGFKKKR